LCLGEFSSVRFVGESVADSSEAAGQRDAQGASLNEVTMETSVGRLESLGQVGFEGDRET
jgi:hypothetical protein